MVMSFPGEAAIHFLKRWKVGKVLAAGRILFFFLGGGRILVGYCGTGKTPPLVAKLAGSVGFMGQGRVFLPLSGGAVAIETRTGRLVLQPSLAVIRLCLWVWLRPAGLE